MTNGVREYRNHWIRCVPRPQDGTDRRWECLVYVFVSQPRDDREPADDACLCTTQRNFESKDSAMQAGLAHARSIIDRRLGQKHDLAPPRA